MHKQKVVYNMMPQVSTPVPNRLLNSLTKQLTAQVAELFDLEEAPLTASLVRVIGSNHITSDTPIGPMMTSIDDLLTMVNREAVVRIEPHEVIIKGIDIGNQSIALITALKGGAFSGTVAVSYVNVHGPRLQPFIPASDKRKLAKRQLANQTLKGMETMLQIVAAYKPTAEEKAND